MTYRIYADGRDFGTDYPTLPAARAVMNRFAAKFPFISYYIRKAPDDQKPR